MSKAYTHDVMDVCLEKKNATANFSWVSFVCPIFKVQFCSYFSMRQIQNIYRT